MRSITATQARQRHQPEAAEVRALWTRHIGRPFAAELHALYEALIALLGRRRDRDLVDALGGQGRQAAEQATQCLDDHVVCSGLGVEAVGAGLAARIQEAGYRLNIARMFAALALIAAMGVFLFAALSLLSHLLLRKWHESALTQEK